MHSSIKKARIFATIALLILTFSFTLPMIAFNGALTQIDNGKGEEVSPLTAKVWNIYNKGRYKSQSTPLKKHFLRGFLFSFILMDLVERFMR